MTHAGRTSPLRVALSQRLPGAVALAAGLLCWGCGTNTSQAQAIVDAGSGQLFGAVINGSWIKAENVSAEVVESAIFARYVGSERQPGETRLTLVPRGETCSNPAYKPAEGMQAASTGIYLATDIDAAPRPAETLPTENLVYSAEFSRWLATNGIEDDAPVIAQLVRVDLEGDGVNEVLVAAERQSGSVTSTHAGDYSVLLLRRLTGDRVVTIPMHADLYAEDCIAECAPTRYRVAATLDVDGDGSLEIIVASQDYESQAGSIHAASDPERVRLEWYCGP